MKKLTEKEKQKIRDKIERLKHLKEPYIKSMGLAIPIFIAFFILMIGMVNNQTVEMFDIKYNISITQDSISNNSYGTIEPIKEINFKKILKPFETLFYLLFFGYLIMIFFIFYLSEYAKYDNEIKILYNKLIGEPKMEQKKIPISERLKQKINLIRFKSPEIVMKTKEKNTIEYFFEENKYTLIVLSIFLLVTIGLVGKEGYLNNVLALLSALITYFVLVGINSSKKYEKDTFALWGFEIVFPIFVVTFCAWVILNVVTTLTGELAKLIWGIVWIIFMIYPSLKFWIKR